MVRAHELACSHGIGHQTGVHGCDGCCGRVFGGLVDQERERILAMKKEIINCVIDYGLTPEKYERVCNDIDALIKGEK
jgi:hypothetical protein